MSKLRVLLPDGRIARQVCEEDRTVRFNGLMGSAFGTERLIIVEAGVDVCVFGAGSLPDSNTGKDNCAVGANASFGWEGYKQFLKWSESIKNRTNDVIREAALRYCQARGLDPNAFADPIGNACVGYNTPTVLDRVIRDMEILQDKLLMQKCLESST
jgi:hypothetical protein